MKGIVNKTQQGWVVSRMVGDGREETFPLHPTDVSTCIQYTDYSEDWTGKEVEFEIVHSWENGEVGVNGLSYAKLIDHIVDTNKMVDKDIDDLKKNLERLDYWKLGYNTAKQKLFTQEEMIEWTMAMIGQYAIGNTNIWDREMLKESLPKK